MMWTSFGEFLHNNYPTKQKTNADRIRAMSDEELAKWLTNFFWGREKEVRLFKLLEWLQQPAEEVASDVLMQPVKEDA